MQDEEVEELVPSSKPGLGVTKYFDPMTRWSRVRHRHSRDPSKGFPRSPIPNKVLTLLVLLLLSGPQTPWPSHCLATTIPGYISESQMIVSVPRALPSTLQGKQRPHSRAARNELPG